MEPGHTTEIRIAVPSGSYAARFKLPLVKLDREPEVVSVSVPENIEPRKARATGPRPRLVTALIVAATLVALAVAIGIRFPERSGSTLDRFWRPLLSPQNPTLLCIGDWDRPTGAAQVETCGQYQYRPVYHSAGLPQPWEPEGLSE